MYGVAAANMLFLPLHGKLKRKFQIERERKTMIAEGVLAIQAGLNPRVLEDKLKAYLGEHASELGEGAADLSTEIDGSWVAGSGVLRFEEAGGEKTP